MRLTIVTLATIALVSCNQAEAPADTSATDPMLNANNFTGTITTGARPARSLAQIRADAAALTAAAERVATESVTLVNARLTSCAGKQAEPVAPPLVVAGAAGNTVSIAAGREVALNVTGATGGFSADWVGVVPTDVSLVPTGGSATIRLKGAATIATAGSYTMRVRDFASPPKTVDITVTTTK